MNAVMTIKHRHEEEEARQLEAAFFGLFHTPEIKARRAARIRQAEQQARQRAAYEARIQEEAQARAREEYQHRERALKKAHQREIQREVADMGASVAGGLTMAASLIGLAMLV